MATKLNRQNYFVHVATCIFYIPRVFLHVVVLQCYDTVGWLMWPVKPSPKWPIMCRVGR